MPSSGTQRAHRNNNKVHWQMLHRLHIPFRMGS